MNRNGFKGKKRPRKVFYPAFWAWEVEKPFSLAQADTKDILDKGTLGTKLWNHMLRKRLPRYQWIFYEGKTRMRFFCYSRELSLVNNLCFTFLVMVWLRKFGICSEVTWQTDWGEEFGGSTPGKLVCSPVNRFHKATSIFQLEKDILERCCLSAKLKVFQGLDTSWLLETRNDLLARHILFGSIKT